MALSEKQIKQALKAKAGFISQAAEALGVTYQAIYDRIKRSDDLGEYYRQIRETQLDMAESQLLKLIREGDLGAICFFLKCQGKARGYIEKERVNSFSDSPEPTEIKIEVVDARREDK